MYNHIKGKKWLILFNVFFLCALFMESIFFMLRPMHKELNDFIGDMLGVKTNYVLILMLVFLVPLLYSLIFTTRYSINIKKHEAVRAHTANKILGLTGTLFLIGFFSLMVFTFGEDASVLIFVLEYYSPFIFLLIALGFVIFLFTLLDEMIARVKTKFDDTRFPKIRKYSPLVFVGLFYCWLLIMPLIFQPVYVIRGELPAKPLVIAHRCGARYAPENTLPAILYASQIGSDGVEIDVQISIDGIPFLMHDDTLKRTTNVTETFPARVDTLACYFNISELQTLNAGSWFVEEDPYDKIREGEVPTDLLDDYENATIPTLEQAMTSIKSNDLIANVDFKTPPEAHPYYDQYFNRCLSVIQAANHDSKVWITAYNNEWLENVTAFDPDLVTVLSLELSEYISPEEFLATGYDMINTAHQKRNEVFREYYEEGIEVNAWTVNMVSRFEQLWALGLYSVTTDEPIEYIRIERPTLLMDKTTYILIWVLSYTVGVAIIIGIKLFLIKKGKYS